MHAGDLAQPVTTVTHIESLLDVAKRFAGSGLPGVVVVDDAGRPGAVLAGSALVRLALPQYLLDDPALAGVLDESASSILRDRLAALTIADALDDEQPDPHPQVLESATVVEVASVMADEHVGLVVVTDARSQVVGVVTAAALLAALLPDA
ncbi:MAG: CBS domain-containing protein [Actinomycetes bacterium]